MKTKSNSIKDIKNYIYNELKNKYSNNEIIALINILFKQYADLDSAHLLAFEDETINESSLLDIVLATQRLRKYEPIQYIIGVVEFLNVKLKVNNSVLIPRSETEQLTSMIIQENKAKALQIIDVCCGSGCIALALKKNLPLTNVIGVDISQEALKVAKTNAMNNHIDVDFQYFDILNNEYISDIQYDIIVSNPPYVRQKEKTMMQKNVLDYEPPIALYVEDDNPLIFYKSLNVFAQKQLKKGGKMYLEINEYLSSQTMALFSDLQFIKEIKKDIYDKERFIFLQKK